MRTKNIPFKMPNGKILTFRVFKSAKFSERYLDFNGDCNCCIWTREIPNFVHYIHRFGFTCDYASLTDMENACAASPSTTPGVTYVGIMKVQKNEIEVLRGWLTEYQLKHGE